MSDHFIDGIRLAANRTNEASGRSWHIPAKTGFRPSFIFVPIAVVVVAVSLLGMVSSALKVVV